MNSNSSFWLLVTAIGAASYALYKGSDLFYEEQKTVKIKNKVWRDIFRFLQSKVDSPDVNPQQPENLEVVRMELLISLEDYIENYPSQKPYLKDLVKNLKECRNKRYPEKIKVIRQTISYLQAPIS